MQKSILSILGPILFIGFASLSLHAQFPTDPRSDSLHIPKQVINLKITDFTNNTISGFSEIYITPRMNGVKTLQLDLHQFQVDSIKAENTTAAFSYNDSLIKIPLNTALSVGDTMKFTVWYQGQAVQGSGGWGGFYWNQGIAFNMGVTLFDIPHGAGRFWYPCFDNFTEKSLYDVIITTLPQHKAVCGGNLISTTTNPDASKTWHWQLNQPVPSYLVSAAVGPFEFVYKEFQGMTGSIPVIMAALAADTTAMKNSFANLEAAFHIYEDFYGPYLWDRVGYVLVPFNGGAMEHATNVAYQKTLVNGNLTYQRVMAHELSHHWWGNLVTCETAEDMWINEGMAVFSEFLFTEQLYNRNSAISDIRTDHASVIRTAHTSDGGYHPLSGVPQEHTYGKHSYDKGGIVAWSLRGYMGDSLFFKGLKSILNARRYGNVNALEFRDILIDSTGYDATPFFDDWILQPGFAEFLLDSFTVQPAGNQFNVTLSTSQRLRAAYHLFTEVPLEITFIKADRTQFTATHMHSGQQSVGTYTVPFIPEAVFINRSQKLFYGVTADEREVKSTGNVTFSYSNFRFNPQSVTDSALVRSEYHWAAPDPNIEKPWLYEITPDRFWKIDGIFPQNFVTTGQFAYDGSTNGPDQIIYAEDSVMLFYRKNSGDLWRPAPNTTVNMQIANDKKGTLTISPLMKGEYCIGTRKQTVGFQENEVESGVFSIHPNPGNGLFSIQFHSELKNTFIQIVDNRGIEVAAMKVSNSSALNLSHLPSGNYQVILLTDGKNAGTKTLIINK